MAFKPNYNRDRHERDRAARAKKDEKLRKKEEKAAQRKAERDGIEGPADDQQGLQSEPAGSQHLSAPGKDAGAVD
jgi:hypothetical protein